MPATAGGRARLLMTQFLPWDECRPPRRKAQTTSSHSPPSPKITRLLFTCMGSFRWHSLAIQTPLFGKNSEPSTLDSQSSTTLFLSSEEPGPSTAALPSPSSSCEPQAFSPGPAVLPPLLPPLPAAAPPGPGAPRRAGLYTVVASSPEAAQRLVDWLPGCPSGPSPCVRGDERERTPAQGQETGRAPRPGSAGRERAEDLRASPPPCARPAATATLEANVGDILVELRTMNGHLDVIARALTKLASSLGPQPQPLPDAPDAN